MMGVSQGWSRGFYNVELGVWLQGDHQQDANRAGGSQVMGCMGGLGGCEGVGESNSLLVYTIKCLQGLRGFVGQLPGCGSRSS